MEDENEDDEEREKLMGEKNSMKTKTWKWVVDRKKTVKGRRLGKGKGGRELMERKKE